MLSDTVLLQRTAVTVCRVLLGASLNTYKLLSTIMERLKRLLRKLQITVGSVSETVKTPINPPGPTQVSHARSAQRAVWLKRMHQWHWISAAVSLVGILMFSVTGITLNHATQIDTTSQVTHLNAKLPSTLLTSLKVQANNAEANRVPLPAALQQWLKQTWSLKLGAATSEWSADELYISLPQPGGDAWVRIDLQSAIVEYEHTDRGWISWLNDLHKGRHTGAVWNAFIDVFAVACLVFSLTGLWILKLHAVNRPSTWPVVGLGLLIPLILILLWMH